MGKATLIIYLISFLFLKVFPSELTMINLFFFLFQSWEANSNTDLLIHISEENFLLFHLTFLSISIPHYTLSCLHQIITYIISLHQFRAQLIQAFSITRSGVPNV